MGPGGEDVAGRLAEAGLKVVGVESRLVGGECPYFGCVPSKMMIRASDLLAEGRRIGDLAGSAEVAPDWSKVAGRIRDEATDDWDDKVAADRFTGKGGILVRGYGSLTGEREVTVGDRVFRARRGVVLNPGTAPAVPPIEGLRNVPYWTNRDIVKATEIPDSLIVLGGGAIGLELAQVFRRFGAEVTVVEAADRLLALEEPEAGELVRETFEAEGIKVRTGVKVGFVGHESGGGPEGTITVHAGDEVLRASRLLVAAGRFTDLEALGVASAGLDPSARTIPVDERMRAAEGLWAVGDVTGKGAFTHISMYQAAIVVKDILGQDGPPADYRALPRVTFTDPEIGAVGLTERQAREKGLKVRTGITRLGDSTRGWIHQAEGFIKVVEADGVLVGATSAGPTGGEVLSALVVAVHAQVPVKTLESMIYAYPTFHRAISEALRALD
ncbi:NAD(P)/FAD-dependent oxidoreductase [Actinocorallia longicatena]|uniref:NAD(P)/FAD-dependent oxidoreductase n=2 Tax=Actinocorallia longicatena TaxID=111803 RepID=A0ABP6QHS4_9ACTN